MRTKNVRRPPVDLDCEPINMWDSFRLSRDGGGDQPYALTHACTRLFGNAHIGRQHLCNLQVPGMIAFDQDAFIEHVYARHNLDLAVVSPSLRAAIYTFASSTIVSLYVGDHPECSWSLADLFAQQPWEPESISLGRMSEAERVMYRERLLQRRAENVYPFHVPTRHNVSVLLSVHTPFEPLIEALDTIEMTAWIHMEGFKQKKRWVG
jgi:hypothetical protein